MSRRCRLFVLISTFCSAAIVAHTLLASEGWGRRARVRRDLTVVEDELARYERRVHELRAQIEAQKKRREVQERVVRHELSYVRQGDLVIDVAL